MQPSQFNYPEFVPDQVLTSSNLNDLFNYLDEQDRLTRANLIGVGIVCGLEVSVSTDGSQLTISQGCGITTGGYLITFPGTTFTEYKSYNAVNPLYYEKFVDIPNKSQIYPLDELFESSVTDGTTNLTSAYLSDKVVLLYVELLEQNAMNCDPSSCDDKGKNIDITFRPLLISISDAAKLQTVTSGYNGTAFQTLPILRMPRFNVPATILPSTSAIFNVYNQILSTSFISSIQDNLTKTYNILLPLIQDIYPTNPFSQLSQSMAFLNDGTITEREAINLQYYYDLFSDIEIAYRELREAGIEALGMCCPDVNLFRLHLLLGNAIADDSSGQLANRQYFIPSPVMGCHCKQTEKVRWLFIRLQLMLGNFYVDYGTTGNFGNFFQSVDFRRRLQDNVIRITPSSLGKDPLAKKAIPFYYQPIAGAPTLLDNWDADKTAVGEADQNLSYNANQYAVDDNVLNPLTYDLEPYNFLRIEGHIGMRYTTALKNIIGIRDRNRLPFDVVALSSDLESVKTALGALGRNRTVGALVEKYAAQLKAPCQFQDLDAQYDTFIAELTCRMCKVMLYFYELSAETDDVDAALSVVPLMQKCNPNYYVQAHTFGYRFEQFYQEYKGVNSIGSMYGSFQRMFVNEVGTNAYYFLLLNMESFYETFADTLGDFDLFAFLEAGVAMVRTATDLWGNLETQDDGSQGVLDTLAALTKIIDLCFQKPMEALYRDYLLRWVNVMMLQKFGFFARKHPGIQHKAGVPMGGTFIIVYHETSQNPTVSNNLFAAAENIDKNIVAEQSAGATAASSTAANKIVVESAKPRAAQAKVKQGMAEVNIGGTQQTAGSVLLNTPAGNSKSILDINDLELFKATNQKEFNDLGILFQQMGTGGNGFTNIIPQIAGGTVIADFYLPYLCCSDCPPIQVTVQEAIPPISISISPMVFSGNDNGPYNIIALPDGDGQVTGEGSSTDTNGKFVFIPSAVKFAATDKSKDITLVYQAFGQSASTKVTVYQVPIADFDVTPVANEDTATLVNNSSAYADKYAWDFGDGQTSSDQNPGTHGYRADGDYIVGLTVSNNIAVSTPVTKPVTVSTPDVTLNMSKLAFCGNDDTIYQLSPNPTDATVTGPGVVPYLGAFGFQPNQVSPGSDPNQVVVLTATKGAKHGTLNVTVNQMPTALFTYAYDDNPGIISFTNLSSSFAANPQWDFGDGSTFAGSTPDPHTFTESGEYVVTLTVFNTESCSAQYQQAVVIQLPQPPTVDINPKIFCVTQSDQVPIQIGTSGGNVTGEGVVDLGTGSFVFQPSLVTVGDQESKQVVITNSIPTFPDAAVPVAVYNVPIIDFTWAIHTDNPLVVSFTSATSYVDTGMYHWDFGDGQSSGDPNPTVTYKTPNLDGYNVILSGSNLGGCGNGAIHQVPVIGQQQFSTKTCFPFAQITLDTVNAYLKNSKNKETATEFNNLFAAYNSQVLGFFKDINGMDSLSVDAQIQTLLKLNAVQLLTNWINQLTAILTKHPELAPVITLLIAILTELIEYIACIQPDDINKAKVSMAEPLNALGKFCSAFYSLPPTALGAGVGTMTQVKALLTDEENRVNSNNESTTKPAYLALLKRIVAVFK